MMTVEEWRTYIEDTYSIDVDYPWAKYPEYSVCRHLDNKKWFVLFMAVPKVKLGLQGEEFLDVINVKLEPMMIDTLRSHEGFFPAYHMNKNSWITISLEGTVPEEEIKNLIDISFSLTVSKIKEK